MVAKLPKDCKQWDALESAGVVRGADVDELFVSVELPDGWCVERDQDPLFSKLLDEKRRQRAMITAKGAVHDSYAIMTVVPRFAVCTPEDGPKRYAAVYDQDCRRLVFRTTGEIVEPADEEDREGWKAFYAQEKVLRAEAAAWAEAICPGFENPAVGWDLPPMPPI